MHYSPELMELFMFSEFHSRVGNRVAGGRIVYDFSRRQTRQAETHDLNEAIVTCARREVRPH